MWSSVHGVHKQSARDTGSVRWRQQVKTGEVEARRKQRRKEIYQASPEKKMFSFFQPPPYSVPSR